MPTHRAPQGDRPAQALTELLDRIPKHEHPEHIVPAGDEWVVITSIKPGVVMHPTNRPKVQER